LTPWPSVENDTFTVLDTPPQVLFFLPAFLPASRIITSANLTQGPCPNYTCQLNFTFDAGFTLTSGTEKPLFHGDFDETELGGTTGVDVVKLARLGINGIVKDVLEIRPGLKHPQTVEPGCSGLRPEYARTVLRGFRSTGCGRRQRLSIADPTSPEVGTDRRASRQCLIPWRDADFPLPIRTFFLSRQRSRVRVSSSPPFFPKQLGEIH
jgi:hypothetical protein